MKKKVLGILGSPKSKGKVATLLAKVLHESERNGNEVKQINLYDIKLDFCRGCMVCRSKGACIINDDLQNLAKEILLADVVVLAAPTYWANVPAIVKNMFDRMTGYVIKTEKGKSPKSLLYKKKEYVIITACSTPFPINIIGGQSKGALRAMNEFFKLSGMIKIDTIVFPNTMGNKTIPIGIMNKAEKVGKSI
ncbi:flavodoxin family protein [Clostridium sp. FP2]|uniref:flavodoxin family protein n=1 Tax=Clostridium sp. FP2 TaxID=2724481 RepID=UPI0013E99831|nr:flavodoxin family protein [Clostridium sp. FP2]MBZ9625579.1 flavodoxin family protein [Clostridium sp. FP2]